MIIDLFESEVEMKSGDAVMGKYITLVLASILAVILGGVIGGFTCFFALLSLRQSGLLPVEEMSLWPDYIVMILGVLISGIGTGVFTWHNLQKE